MNASGEDEKTRWYYYRDNAASYVYRIQTMQFLHEGFFLPMLLHGSIFPSVPEPASGLTLIHDLSKGM